MIGFNLGSSAPRFSMTEVPSPGVSASPSRGEQPGTEFLREHGGVWFLSTVLALLLLVFVIAGRRHRS